MKSFNFENLYIFNLIELNVSQEIVKDVYNFLNTNSTLDIFFENNTLGEFKLVKEKISLISKEVSMYSVFSMSLDSKKKILIFNSSKTLDDLVDNYQTRIDKVIDNKELIELTDFITDFLEFKYKLFERSINFFENSDKPYLIVNLLHYLNNIKSIDLNIAKNICERLLEQKVIKKIPEGLIFNNKLNYFLGKDYINDVLIGSQYYLSIVKKNNFNIDKDIYGKYRDMLSSNNSSFGLSDYTISLIYSNVNDIVKIYRYIKIEENSEKKFSDFEIEENLKIILSYGEKKNNTILEKIAERKRSIIILLNEEIKPYLIAKEKYVIDLKLIIDLVYLFSGKNIAYLDIDDFFYAFSKSKDFIKLSNCFVFDKNYKVSFKLYNFINSKLSESNFHINIEMLFKEYEEKIEYPNINLDTFLDLIKEKYIVYFSKKFLLVDSFLLYNLQVDNDSFIKKIKLRSKFNSENSLVEFIVKNYGLSKKQSQYIVSKISIKEAIENEQRVTYNFEIINKDKVKDYVDNFVGADLSEIFLSNLSFEKDFYFPNLYENLSSAVSALYNSFKSPQSINSLSRFLSKKDLILLMRPFFESNQLFIFEKDTLLKGEWNDLNKLVTSFINDISVILKKERAFTALSIKKNMKIKELLEKNITIVTLGDEFIENLLLYNSEAHSNTISNHRIFSFKEIPRLNSIIKDYVYQKRKTSYSEITSYLENFFGIRYNVTKKDFKDFFNFYISPEIENVYESLEYYRKLIKEQLKND
jgi:UDP-N-acetylglucosamine transferase subunit ALG13